MDRDSSTMSAREAADALGAARTTMRRSRRAAATAFMRASLVFWGTAWMIGYVTLQALPLWCNYVVWGLIYLSYFGLFRRRGTERGAREVVTGWEDQFHRSWWALVAGSVALGVIVAPAPLYVVALLAGALWGVALVLFGLVAGDRPVAILGSAIVLMAMTLRIVVPGAAIALFGLSAGGLMIALGLVRVRRGQ